MSTFQARPRRGRAAFLLPVLMSLAAWPALAGPFPLPMPDWQTEESATPFSLSCQQDSGQFLTLPAPTVPPTALMINYWASWCLPCLYELPELARLQERLATSGVSVRVMAVSSDTEPAKMSAALAAVGRHPESCRLTRPDQAPSPLPQTLLIAPDGRILARQTGSAQWDSTPVMADILARLKTKP